MNEDEQKTLEMMTHPNQWPARPLLPLQRRTDNGKEFGILGEAPMGRFVWYKGAMLYATAKENGEALKNAKVFLAPGLEDLIKEGWEVD